MVLDSLLMLHVMFKGLATAGVTRAVTVSLSIAAGLCRLFMTVFLRPTFRHSGFCNGRKSSFDV